MIAQIQAIHPLKARENPLRLTAVPKTPATAKNQSAKEETDRIDRKAETHLNGMQY